MGKLVQKFESFCSLPTVADANYASADFESALFWTIDDSGKQGWKVEKDASGKLVLVKKMFARFGRGQFSKGIRYDFYATISFSKDSREIVYKIEEGEYGEDFVTSRVYETIRAMGLLESILEDLPKYKEYLEALRLLRQSRGSF